MTTWIGYQTVNPDHRREVGERVRKGELTPESSARAVDPTLAAKVRDFRSKLPQGCTIVASYQPIGVSPDRRTEVPGVLIVETADPAHVDWITGYYAGFLSYVWHPYQSTIRA